MVPARGVYLPELRWGGIRQGGSHWPGTCWEGDTHGGDPNKVPKVAVEPGVQGPTPAGSQHLLPWERGHIWRGCQGALELEPGLEEMPQGSLRVEMGPAPPCTTATLGRDFLIYPP